MYMPNVYMPNVVQASSTRRWACTTIRVDTIPSCRLYLLLSDSATNLSPRDHSFHPEHSVLVGMGFRKIPTQQN